MANLFPDAENHIFEPNRKPKDYGIPIRTPSEACRTGQLHESR